MNLTQYKEAFVEAFDLEDQQILGGLEYNSIEEWDSIGHMGLIAALEESFDISMETDDIVDFSSFKKGVSILAKYGVEITLQ